MYDVVALGELLIDFIQNGRNSKGNPVFEANPGGRPIAPHLLFPQFWNEGDCILYRSKPVCPEF